MKTLLADLWYDLRAKRLWPLAVLLLAGLVAVPVVLKKSAEEPAITPVASEPRAAPEPKDLKGLAAVTLEEGVVEEGSTLNTFEPSDPFRPPEKVVRGSKQAESGGSSSGPSDSAGASAPTDGAGGGSPIGGDGDFDFGGPGTPPPVGEAPGDNGGDQKTTTRQYTYVIDVTFTANGRTRKLEGMERLDMLPSATSPLLLFLGVSSNAGNAVFLVDSTLDAAGEGSCKPSTADCAFLHLGAGSEHVFTNEDGDTYELRIDEIRKVKVDATAAASSSKRGRTASAAAGPAAAMRRFAPQLLADVVSVSSPTAGDSNSDQDRR